MLIRNTPFARDLFSRLLTEPACAAYRNMTDCCQEQDCLWKLMSGRSSKFAPEQRDRRYALVRAQDWDCRDGDAYHAFIHNGPCRAPLVFHGLGTNIYRTVRP